MPDKDLLMGHHGENLGDMRGEFMSRIGSRKSQKESISNLFQEQPVKKRATGFHIYGVAELMDMMDIVGRSKRSRVPLKDITNEGLVNESNLLTKTSINGVIEVMDSSSISPQKRLRNADMLSIKNLISSQTSVSTVSQPVLEELNPGESVDDSESEPDLIVPTSEMHQQYSRGSTVREEDSGDEEALFDSQLGNFDEELEGRYVVDETQNEHERNERNEEVEVVAISDEENEQFEEQSDEDVAEVVATEKVEEELAISEQIEQDTSEPLETSIEKEAVQTKKAAINKKRASSLQEICFRTNNHKLGSRVGLSKRLKIESLHKNIVKR